MPTDFHRLFTLAASQQGYFSASQAAAHGYSQQNQARHVKVGNWQRVGRGIFRLEHYPPAKNPDLVVCHLWALNLDDQPQGVFSYETALQFHDLSDWTGHGIHMTVPKGFRRHSEPRFAVVIHKEELDDHDTLKRDCFYVTSPLKTVLDLLFHGAIEQRFLKQAMAQAWERGLISKRQIESRKFTDSQRAKVSWLLHLADIDDVEI
jgi:predicted transcriptional regulator of viral defense system